MNQTIYKDNKGNAIRFSKISKIEGEMPFTGLGIKYVSSGEETYYANNKKFTVKEGEYIIGNDYTSSIVCINQKQAVEGLCIDISAKIISNVAEFHDLNETDLIEFLLSDQFLVNRYHIKSTFLGPRLNEVSQKIKMGTCINEFQQNELFYTLAESIISDQRFVFDHLNKLDFKKTITNKEVVRTVLDAKSFIDQHITENFSLEVITSHIGISKYHFIRVFKAAFGISPYQYQKWKRLELAKLDLLRGNEILFTAVSYGFADVPTFSKAFKQAFGQSPSQFVK